MDRETLLQNLSIRLTYLSDSSDNELNSMLDELRRNLRSGSSEQELSRTIDRLTKKLMASQQAAPAVNGETVNGFAGEFARQIKSIRIAKGIDGDLARLADELTSTGDLQQQLQCLRETFKLIQQGAKSDTGKKSSAFGGWLDRKARKVDESWTSFFENSAALLRHVLEHIDVLNGNTTVTKYLKEQLEDSGDIDVLESVLEDTLDLLARVTERMGEERTNTQTFLGDLREKLHSVEGVIYSLLSDDKQSMDRAETLGQAVASDVESIGKAVEEDELTVLKKTVESRLLNLTAKVSDYLVAEREHHEQNRGKVRDLTRKVREMELEASQLRSEIKSKQDMAMKDPLTGVYNRAGYEARVEEEFARRQRVSTPLSIVFVDCNKFKEINDTFGHDAGDVVLVKVAETLARRARTSDIVCRFGGDEFVVLLPDTALDGARVFAEDAFKKILAAGFNNNGKPLDVSISCGVTEVKGDDTPVTALKRADEAMYKAKKMEGVRVALAEN